MQNAVLAVVLIVAFSGCASSRGFDRGALSEALTSGQKSTSDGSGRRVRS